MLKKWVVSAFALVCLSAVPACADENAVRQAFQSKFPKMTVESVSRTPFANMFEVVIDGQVFYTELGATATPSAAIVRAPGEAAGRKHPRVVAGPDGETLLVWTERTAWARGGSLAWQVFDRTGTPAAAAGSLPGIPPWSFAAAIARPSGGYLIFY